MYSSKNPTRRAFRFFILLPLLSLLVACGGKKDDKPADDKKPDAAAKSIDSPIVGQWKRVQMVAEGKTQNQADKDALEEITNFTEVEMSGGADVQLAFNADGTGSQQVIMPKEKPMAVPLKYALDGQLLTITMQPGTKDEIAYRLEIMDISGSTLILREYLEPTKQAYPDISNDFRQSASRVWTLEAAKPAK